MPVSIKGTGGGSVTLDAAAAATNTTLTIPNVTGTVLQSGTAVTVAQGGTGATSLAANNVLLGNGTSAVQVVAPGTSGNVLTSNGTAWTSATPAAGGVTSIVAGTGITTSGTTAVTVNVATTAGAVGTYALLGNGGTSSFAFGSTYAGSSLAPAGVYLTCPFTAISISASTQSGTWRAMGYVGGSVSAPITLFLRIA